MKKFIPLNIQLFASNAYTITSAYQTDISIANNTSYVYIQTTLTTNSSTYNQTGNAYVNFKATVGSQTFSTSNQTYTIGKNGTKTFTAKLGPFKHNTDGTLGNVTVSSYCYLISTMTYNPSRSVSMSTIPRASSVTATDANIGSATTININKASSGFTTTLKYSFGSLSGTIVEKTSNVSYGWTVPTSFYAQIPNAQRDTCTITAETYNGSTLIGTSTTTFIATASSSSSAPTATITVVDTNATTTALTSSNKTIVLGQSNAQCTITKSAKNSATIKSVTINGVSIGTSATTYTFNKATTSTFTLVVTDSRGYSTTVTATGLTQVNYISPTIQPTITRNTPTDGKINIDFTGNWFSGSFGKTTNTLTVQYRYREGSSGSWKSWTTIASSNIDTSTVNVFKSSKTIQLSDFDYEKSFTFEIRATDKIITSPTATSIPIQRGKPIYWWNEKGFYVLGDFTVNDNELQSKIEIKSATVDINNGVGLLTSDRNVIVLSAWFKDTFNGYVVPYRYYVNNNWFVFCRDFNNNSLIGDCEIEYAIINM